MINVPQEVLAEERVALEKDRVRYLECLNGKLLKDRETDQEKRDGLILFHHVYKHIVNSETADES